MKHRDASPASEGGKGIHIIPRWPPVATKAAREAMTIAAADVGGVIQQTDTKDFWIAKQTGTGSGPWAPLASASPLAYRAAWYGAVGDDTTDDAAAIQAALDDAEAAGGGDVWLEAKTYKITVPLVIPGAAHVHLRGAGWGTVLHNTGTGNGITIGDAGTDQTADVRVVDLWVTGNGSSAHGIYMARMHSAVVERVRLSGHGGDGLNTLGCYASQFYRVYANNNTGSGIKHVAHATSGTDFIETIQCRALANGAKGIWVDNTDRGSNLGIIERCDIEGNAIGLKMDSGSSGSNSEAWQVLENYFENQTGLNAQIGADGGTSSFRGLAWFGNNCSPGTVSAAANAVAFDRVLGAMVDGCLFSTSNFTATANTTVTYWGAGNVLSGSTAPQGMTTGRSSLIDFAIRDTGGSELAVFSMSSSLPRVNYPFAVGGGVYPGSAANPSAIQSACGLYAGAGTPDNATGQNGDLALKSDGTLWFRAAAAWSQALAALGAKLFRIYTPDASAWATLENPDGTDVRLNYPLRLTVNALIELETVLTYGVSVALNAALGNSFKITVTDGVAFAIANPTGMLQAGQRMTVRVINSSGGAMGAVTWGANYKMRAWVSPADGFSRSVTFIYNSGNVWVEASRTEADVPN